MRLMRRLRPIRQSKWLNAKRIRMEKVPPPYDVNARHFHCRDFHQCGEWFSELPPWMQSFPRGLGRDRW